eukprot:1053285-Amphidinium_carterae.1
MGDTPVCGFLCVRASRRDEGAEVRRGRATWAIAESAVYPPELNHACRALSDQQAPKALNIFGGRADGVDGLAAFLKDLGAATVPVDVVNGADQDLHEDTLWQKL